MEKNGHQYDWCYPADGQSFPAVEPYDGVIIFGGAPSVNDVQTHCWVLDELAFIETCLKHDKSFFGICLGAQMLARVLGSTVSEHPDKLEEVGFCQVNPTAQGAGFLKQPLKFMQWHNEGFDLPQGAIHLAQSNLFANQAFAYGENVVGVQYHPEVNLDVLKIWHERNSKRSTGVLDDATKAVHVADAIENEQAITAWLDGFLSNWVFKAAKAA